MRQALAGLAIVVFLAGSASAGDKKKDEYVPKTPTRAQVENTISELNKKINGWEGILWYMTQQAEDGKHTSKKKDKK